MSPRHAGVVNAENHCELRRALEGAWRLAKWVTLQTPVQNIEHHYLLTEKMMRLQILASSPCGIDYRGRAFISVREREGMQYCWVPEPVGTPWKVGGTPWDFGHELLQPNLDNIADRLELAFERIPALAEAGIKDAINGPFTFDLMVKSMIGLYSWHVTNYWCAVGVMAGVPVRAAALDRPWRNG